MCAIRRFSIQRLPGTALFYALLITTLVGIVLTALVAAWMYFRQSHALDMQQWHDVEVLEQGLLYALTSDDYYYDEAMPEITDSARLSRYAWGLYDLVNIKHRAQSTTALIGNTKSIQTKALVIADTRKALALSGNSQIIGNASLPSAGITKTTVNGIGHHGGPLVIGNTTKGDGTFPSFDRNRLNIEPPAFSLPTRLSELPDSFHNPYASLPIVIDAHTIRLNQKQWSGHIFVRADSLIRVDKNVSLSGVILQAPLIEIDTGFTGQLQAFSSSAIYLGTDVQLDFPSVLAIIPPENIYRATGRLAIGNGSEISGLVIGTFPQNGDGERPLATIKNSMLTGEVYWQGGMELSGQVNGNLYCDNFFYRGNGGQFYFNYLVNGRIDLASRSEHYGYSLLNAEGKKKVLLWLN